MGDALERLTWLNELLAEHGVEIVGIKEVEYSALPVDDSPRNDVPVVRTTLTLTVPWKKTSVD